MPTFRGSPVSAGLIRFAPPRGSGVIAAVGLDVEVAPRRCGHRAVQTSLPQTETVSTSTRSGAPNPQRRGPLSKISSGLSEPDRPPSSTSIPSSASAISGAGRARPGWRTRAPAGRRETRPARASAGPGPPAACRRAAAPSRSPQRSTTGARCHAGPDPLARRASARLTLLSRQSSHLPHHVSRATKSVTMSHAGLGPRGGHRASGRPVIAHHSSSGRRHSLAESS